MNSFRSSVSRMARTGVPRTRTPYLASDAAGLQLQAAVERRLSAEGEEDRVDLFLDDDALDELRRDRVR
jgi:hypothetical protein